MAFRSAVANESSGKRESHRIAQESKFTQLSANTLELLRRNNRTYDEGGISVDTLRAKAGRSVKISQTFRSALSKHESLSRMPAQARVSPRIPSPTFRKAVRSLGPSSIPPIGGGSGRRGGGGSSSSSRISSRGGSRGGSSGSARRASPALSQSGRAATTAFRGAVGEAPPRHFCQLRNAAIAAAAPQPTMGSPGGGRFRDAQLYESSLQKEKRALLDEHYRLVRRVEEKQRSAAKREARKRLLAQAMARTGGETKAQRRNAAKYARFVREAFQTSYDDEYTPPAAQGGPVPRPDGKHSRRAGPDSCTAFAGATASSPQVGRKSARQSGGRANIMAGTARAY